MRARPARGSVLARSPHAAPNMIHCIGDGATPTMRITSCVLHRPFRHRDESERCNDGFRSPLAYPSRAPREGTEASNLHKLDGWVPMDGWVPIGTMAVTASRSPCCMSLSACIPLCVCVCVCDRPLALCHTAGADAAAGANHWNAAAGAQSSQEVLTRNP